MDSLKAWWEKTGREIFAVAAIITVCATIIYWVVSLLLATVGLVITWLGLGWLVRGWIGACFGYLIVEAWYEYRTYKRNPDDYGFWNEDDTPPEKEPTETGVE